MAWGPRACSPASRRRTSSRRSSSRTRRSRPTSTRSRPTAAAGRATCATRRRPLGDREDRAHAADREGGHEVQRRDRSRRAGRVDGCVLRAARSPSDDPTALRRGTSPTLDGGASLRQAPAARRTPHGPPLGVGRPSASPPRRRTSRDASACCSSAARSPSGRCPAGRVRVDGEALARAGARERGEEGRGGTDDGEPRASDARQRDAADRGERGMVGELDDLRRVDRGRRGGAGTTRGRRGGSCPARWWKRSERRARRRGAGGDECPE